MYQVFKLNYENAVEPYRFNMSKNAGTGQKLLSFLFHYVHKNQSTSDPGGLLRRPRKGRLTSVRRAVPLHFERR